MVSPLPSLKRFASLNSQSETGAIKAAVVDVISDLRTTVENTPDTGKSRRAIADLLSFIHSLPAGAHPGRIELAQSISQKILPLLYKQKPAQSIEVDTYEHLQAENLLAGFLSSQLAETLSLIQGLDPNHPGYGKGRRREAIPSLCLLAPAYASGLRELVNHLLMARCRTQQIEQNIYKPMKSDYMDKGRNPESLFEDKRTYLSKIVRELFDWASEIETGLNYRKAQNKGTEANSDKGPDQDYSKEESLILELLDKLKLHSEKHDYFLPRSAGFKLIDCLCRLNKGRFVKGVKELHNATLFGEDHNYIVRQVDRLANDMEPLTFDIVALSAHMIGEKLSCLSYKALHSNCIGSARSRAGMLEARPLVSAELGRQPIHLAKKILSLAESTQGDADELEDLLNLFFTNIKDISTLRFEQELQACAGIFRCSNLTQTLAKWLDLEEANPDNAFMHRQKVTDAIVKKWA